MITDYRNFSPKMTVVAITLLISICFISLTISCVSGVSGVKRGDTVKEYTLEKIDTPPKAIHMIQPIYPFEAKVQRIEGRVVVNLIVTKEGTVRDASVFQSSPEDIFDQAALDSVKQWKFDPGRIKGGEAVDTRVRVPIIFELHPDPTVPSN